jgi:methyl-accepting chemotaxis protein
MLTRIKIGPRLAAAFAIPMIALALLAGYNLLIDWKTRSEMASLSDAAAGVADISRLVHELQRERGLSVLFVSSKGAQMRDDLTRQRKATDEQRNTLGSTLATLRANATTAKFIEVLDRAESAVKQLDARRREIDGLAVEVEPAFAFMTDTIARLIAAGSEISGVSTEPRISAAITAYLYLINGKELAGQERASGAGGIAGGRFDTTTFTRFLSLGAAQETYFGLFAAAANAEQRQAFTRAMTGSAANDVTRIRQTVAAGGPSGQLDGIDSKAWFAAASERINALKTVEDRVAADLAALTAAIAGDATQRFTALFSVLGMGLIASILIVVVMARSITRPVMGLAGIMRTLAEGDTSVDVAGTQRGDEIGEMSRAVEVFKLNAIERARLIAEQRETEERARAERSAAMHQLAEQFERAVGQIIDTVSSASTELEASASAMTRTAERTEKLSTTVASASEEASVNVQSVASASDEMTASVTEIGRQVLASSGIAKQAVKQVQDADARIAELSQAGSRIGDVVRLIAEVAEQTNLLALNATIEAARAGEAGRGFAVVAQEVKALAGQTAKATSEIESQVAGMQDATRISVATVKEIGATIIRMSEIAETIAAAVEEQGAATQEIARNVQHAAAGTSDVASNISEVNLGARETGAACTEVLSSAQSLANESSHLKAEVERFLTTVRAA